MSSTSNERFLQKIIKFLNLEKSQNLTILTKRVFFQKKKNAFILLKGIFNKNGVGGKYACATRSSLLFQLDATICWFRSFYFLLHQSGHLFLKFAVFGLQRTTEKSLVSHVLPTIYEHNGYFVQMNASNSKLSLLNFTLLAKF